MGVGLYDCRVEASPAAGAAEGAHCAGRLCVSCGRRRVFIDSSSTALAIVEHIRPRRDLTVGNNSRVVAQELQGCNVTVVMPGGTLHHDTVSLIDVGGLSMLQPTVLRRAFSGARP